MRRAWPAAIPCAAQKDRQLAQSRRIAPRSGDSRGHHRAQAAHLVQSLGRCVEHGRQRLAEMLDDPPRERRPDALYLAGEIALQRGHRGRTEGLEVLDPELLAVPGMVLEAAAQAQSRADLEPGQAADHGDAPAQVVVAALDHRDRIAALLVDVEHLVERAFDQEFDLLARFRHLPHPVGERDALRLGSQELLAAPPASSRAIARLSRVACGHAHASVRDRRRACGLPGASFMSRVTGWTAAAYIVIARHRSFAILRDPSRFASDSRFAKVRMHWPHARNCAALRMQVRIAQNSTFFKRPRRATAMARSMLHALSERGKREKESRGNRGFGSDGYFGFDSCRRGRRAVRIDLQSAAGRSDGHVRTAVGVRDRVPAGEREKSGNAPDRNSFAACKPRGGVGASGFTRASTRGYTTGRR